MTKNIDNEYGEFNITGKESQVQKATKRLHKAVAKVDKYVYSGDVEFNATNFNETDLYIEMVQYEIYNITSKYDVTIEVIA